MATHTSAKSLIASLEKLPAKVEKSNLSAVNESALALKTSVLTSFRSASGGDLKLSGVGKNGAKVSASYKVTAGKTPSALLRATGPAHFIEKPSRSHVIGGKRGRGRSKALLVINGAVITGPVRHPGAPAKRAWTKGIEHGLPFTRHALNKSFGWLH